MAYSKRITQIECSKYSTTFTSPNHGFPRGAEVQVKGVPELGHETFVVNHPSSNTFSISRNVSVEIESIDAANSIVHTKAAHQIGDTHTSVKLCGFDMDSHSHVDRFYSISEVVDEVSVKLKEYCKESKADVPAKLVDGLRHGFLKKDDCSVVLPKQVSCRTGASAVLVCRQPRPKKACIPEWQAALQAAERFCKLLKVKDPEHPKVSDLSMLRVGKCGWEHCSGIFQRSGDLQFKMEPGLVSLQHVEGLGWCLLADVKPKYPLDMERRYLQLASPSAPQLLYIRRDADVFGLWSPVIGPAPGPMVTPHQEVPAVLANVCNQPSALFTPVVCSSVLDTLCNYFFADWRGGMNCSLHRFPFWGMSTVEALVAALKLWHDIAACSTTCRAWHTALKPFANQEDLCHRALRLTLPAPAASGLRSLSVRDTVDLVAMFAKKTWEQGRFFLHMPSFRQSAWPALISSVKIQSELTGEDGDDDLFEGPVGTLLNHHAPRLMDFAKKILPLPLAWKTIPQTLGVHSISGQRFAVCELTESTSAKDQSSAAAVQVNEEGNIQVLALDGARLLPIADEALSLVIGLQYVASTSGSYTRRVQPIPAGEPCGTPYCSRDERDCPFCEDLLEGRLGASQLGGRFRLNFLAGSGKLIILEICFEVPSFFATSKDSDLVGQLRQLLPWSIEGSDSEEVESSAAYVTDEDEDEDDDAAEEEEVEDEAMASETPNADGEMPENQQ